MGLTRYEQETVINFNAEESKATIYTSDPVWMRKLQNYRRENGAEFILVEEGHLNGDVISQTYEFPKKLITIRSKTRVAQALTDEQRAAAAEKMRKVNEMRRMGKC